MAAALLGLMTEFTLDIKASLVKAPDKLLNYHISRSLKKIRRDFQFHKPSTNRGRTRI